MTGAEELAAGSDLAAAREDSAVIDLVGSAEAEAATWTVVEGGDDPGGSGFGRGGQGVTRA